MPNRAIRRTEDAGRPAPHPLKIILLSLDERQGHGQKPHCPVVIGKRAEFAPHKILDFVGAL